MSFKSREKKRRAKLADQRRNVASRRQQRSEETKARHFLTIVTRHCCCNRCGCSLRADRHECVYRHTPREILCLDCATALKIKYRPSRRWEQRNRKGRKPTPRTA